MIGHLNDLLRPVVQPIVTSLEGPTPVRTLPLATLRRHQSRITLLAPNDRERGGWTADDGEPSTLRFVSHHEAVAYLRYWKTEPGAMAALRDALHRHTWHPAPRYTDDQVIEALATHLASGRLVLSVETPPPGIGAGVTEEPEEAVAPPPPPPSLPPAPPPSILPVLEEVQIEGARVLPEVLQTLEQIDLTLSEIDLATVSLEPVPSGVPPISAALAETGDSITATIDSV